MQRSLCAYLGQEIGNRVTIRGWLHAIRPLGKISFLILRDRSGLCQVVVTEAALIKKISALHIGSILSVKGTVVKNPSADLGVELVDPQVDIEVAVSLPPPIEYYKPEIPSDLEHILDNRPVALRNQKIQAVFRIQAELVHAYRLYMHDKVGAVEYFPPNLIGASSEGGAEFFTVDYYGYPATLAQSSQLYKQIMVGVNERVFALAPFFRAEPSHTRRHLSEGRQFEFEMGFFDDWKEILTIQEECIKFMFSFLEKECKKELYLLGNPLPLCPQDIPFPQLTFAQAQQIAFEQTGIDERQEDDLSPQAEKALGAYVKEKYHTEFVFVTDWKTAKRPFYAKPYVENPSLTATFDLLCRGMEITSGGERRHSYESMVEGLKTKELNPQDFTDYLSIFQGGMPPHGGFGMGLERLTMTLLQLDNIRMASIFPSDTKRIAGVKLKAHIIFGADNIKGAILHLLREKNISFSHLTHEEAHNSAEALFAQKGISCTGIKALILRGKSSHKNYQFNLPNNCKLDMKAVSEIVGEKCEFETPQAIEERFGLLVGGVPPFGKLLNIPAYFDQSLHNCSLVSFSCGLKTESIVMELLDLSKLLEPEWFKFSKE